MYFRWSRNNVFLNYLSIIAGWLIDSRFCARYVAITGTENPVSNRPEIRAPDINFLLNRTWIFSNELLAEKAIGEQLGDEKDIASSKLIALIINSGSCLYAANIIDLNFISISIS